MRRLNLKLFLGLTCSLAVVVGATFAVHWFQTGRIARALLWQADRAEQQGNPDQFVRFLGRYVEMAPEDSEARVRLATAMSDERVARSPGARTRAVLVLEQALARKPDRDDLRLRLVRLALALKRSDLAREHLTLLSKSRPNDAEVEDLFGQLAESESKWDAAVRWLRLTAKHDPARVDAHVRLADILRRRFAPENQVKQAEEADKLMAALVAQNPKSFEAHLARWRYLQQWTNFEDSKQLEAAAPEIEHALQLAPTDADVLLAASDLAQYRKDYDSARQRLNQGRQLYPQDPRMYRELAWLEIRVGPRAGEPATDKPVQRDKAIAWLRQGTDAIKGEARTEMLWMLANLLIDDKQVEEAGRVMEEMSKANCSPGSIDYLQARVYIHNNNWPDAVVLLERSRKLFDGSPELGRQADFLLAQCYEQLNDREAHTAVLQRVVGNDPANLRGLTAMASIEADAGQLDRAVNLYRQALLLPGSPPTLWLEIARLVVLRNLQSGKPDWKDIENALNLAAEKNPDAVEVTLLRVEALVAQSTRERGPLDAARLVQQAEDLLRKKGEQLALQGQEAQLSPEKKDESKGQQAAVWAALAGLAEFRKDSAGAVAALDDAEKQVGDIVPLRQARAQLWLKRAATAEATTTADARAALERLAQGSEKYSSQDQGRLLSTLAEGQYRLGNLKEAERLWGQQAQLPQQKKDVRLRLLLFEVGMLNDDDQQMQRSVTELQAIEGEDGPLGRYCAAMKLIWKARQQKNTEGLEEARRLLDKATARRPSWPAVLIARAEIEDLQGKPEEAIASYRKAIDLGERSPRVVRQLVDLLYKRQRYDDADREIQRLQKQAPSPELQRLLVTISLLRQDTTQAAEQALGLVSADSKDYRDHLWLGLVLAADPQHVKDAEAHLRQAVELGPEKPEAWTGLVQFLAANHRLSEAEAMLGDAKTRVPDEQKAMTLAQCYEAIGRLELAQENFQAALAAHPQDVPILRSVAAFYLRAGNLTKAEPPLRRLMDPKLRAPVVDAAWARRSLALALAGRDDYRRLPEALALVGLKLGASGKPVEEPVPTTDDPIEEQRARARVLAKLPSRENRDRAIGILDELGRRQALSGDDRFFLAQLYETNGLWAKASEILRQLTVQGGDPVHLGYYAQCLLRRGQLLEADRYISKLEQVEKSTRPGGGTADGVMLRAQWLEAKGQPDKAVEFLRAGLERPEARPDRWLALIGILARQKQFTAALDQCKRARAVCGPERAGSATVAVLRIAQAPGPQCAEAEKWLREEIGKKPKSSTLWLHLADLYDLQARYADAETAYREALKLDDCNLVALNNLAWLLAVKKPEQAAEAETLINRAIELLGPRPELLDTRATVYLAMKRSDLAIKDLQTANADQPAPTRDFHLALAHQLANDSQAAKAILLKATTAGLKQEQLHPVERAMFTKLKSELEQR